MPLLSQKSFKSNACAFTLVELSVALIILGLVAAMALKMNDATGRKECYTQVKSQLERIRESMERYAMKNDRFPMPARRNVGVEDPTYGREIPLIAPGTPGEAVDPALDIVTNPDSSVAVFGALPFSTLGISGENAVDCWGNKLTYVVTKDLTKKDKFLNNTTKGAIKIKTNTTIVYLDEAGYAVIGHGEDQLGAIKANDRGADRKWCTADGTLKTPNCAATTSGLISAQFNNGKDAAANYFDDMIIFRGKPWRMGSSNVYCWGNNSVGQTGTGNAGTNVLVPTPVIIPSGVSRFKDVSYGFTGACAVGDNGKVYCFGHNGNGNLGHGSTDHNDNRDRPTPVDMSGIAGTINFTSVSVGYTHSCALDDTGKAYCWGYNGSGALGAGYQGGFGGHPTFEPKPVAVDMSTLPPGVTFQTIAASKTTNAGTYVTCALGTDQKIYCWGGMGSGVNNVTQPQLMSGLTYTSLYVEGTRSCATGTDGEAYCWNFGGITTPLVRGGNVPPGVKFTSIINDYNTTMCALGDDNKVYCWVYDMMSGWLPPDTPRPASFKSLSYLSSFANNVCGISVADKVSCATTVSATTTNLPSGAGNPTKLANTILTYCTLTQ